MRRRILASLIGVILTVVIVVCWVWWRHGTRTAQSQQVTQQAQTTAPEGATTMGGEETRDLTGDAIRLEHAMRDWGTDPAIDPASLKGQDAGTVLSMLRGSSPSTPIADLIAFTPEADAGPHAPNPACNGADDPSILCTGWKDAGEWWHGQAWGYGARWADGPTATVNADGTVTVEGTVRTIMVGRDTFGVDADAQWKAVTPAWESYPVVDIISFDADGKATKVVHTKPDPWWTDPWLDKWDGNMASALATGTRIAIPVTGTLAYDGLLWDTETERLPTPATMGDLDGKVDWALWDGLSHPGEGATCQNPVACG